MAKKNNISATKHMAIQSSSYQTHHCNEETNNNFRGQSKEFQTLLCAIGNFQGQSTAPSFSLAARNFSCHLSREEEGP